MHAHKHSVFPWLPPNCWALTMRGSPRSSVLPAEVSGAASDPRDPAFALPTDDGPAAVGKA